MLLDKLNMLLRMRIKSHSLDQCQRNNYPKNSKLKVENQKKSKLKTVYHKKMTRLIFQMRMNPRKLNMI
jgi:hypothetical protein